MASKNKSPRTVFVSLMVQQCALAIIGLVWIIWQTLATPAQWAVSARSVLSGLALAGVLIALAALAERLFPVFMARLNDTVVALWRKIGVELTPTVIVALALGAGIGEELLFRGALQGAMTDWFGPWVAVAVASIVFGAMHAATAAYFVAAMVIGGVLGTAYYLSGSLIAVIIAHTVYDIWALQRLARLLEQSADLPQP